MATGLSAYVFLLHNDFGEPVGAINKRYPRYSRNTISRHTTIDPNAAQKTKTSKSCGRLKKISNRNEMKIIRMLKLVRKTHDGNFTSKQIQYLSGVNNVTTRTVRNILNKNVYTVRAICNFCWERASTSVHSF